MDLSPTPNLDDDSFNVPIKRPPDDEEEFDLQNTPKRQALEDFHGGLSASRASSEASGYQLLEKSPEDLVALIQEMKASHAREMAEVREQYSIVSRQLEQMRILLNDHFTTQVAAIQKAQKDVANIRPPPPLATLAPTPSTIPTPGHVTRRSFSIPSQIAVTATGHSPTPTTSVLGTPRQETPTSTALSQTPTQSLFHPANIEPSTTVELKVTPSSIPNEPPKVEPSTLFTVQEVWQEYCYGRNGNTPLEQLEIIWGARWRKDQKLRDWYGRRKAICDKIRQYIADGIDEQTAVTEVEVMRRGRTLNWLSRILLEDRKAMKKQWKEAQSAAKAAKAAMNGDPVMNG